MALFIVRAVSKHIQAPLISLSFIRVSVRYSFNVKEMAKAGHGFKLSKIEALPLKNLKTQNEK